MTSVEFKVVAEEGVEPLVAHMDLQVADSKMPMMPSLPRFPWCLGPFRPTVLNIGRSIPPAHSIATPTSAGYRRLTRRFFHRVHRLGGEVRRRRSDSCEFLVRLARV
jgi:hypothetical protein